jgi:hypothetical protein
MKILSTFKIVIIWFFLTGLLSGCANSDTKNKLPYTSDIKYNRALDACYAEAVNIIYSAPPRTSAAYGAKIFFAHCMKSKGYEVEEP